MTSQSSLSITRTFHLNDSYLGQSTTVIYTFACRPIISGRFGLPVDLTLFRDKQLKNLATSVTYGNFSNINGVSPNMTWSFDPAVGLTITGLSGANITFIPGTSSAYFNLTIEVQHGTNSGTIGPSFQNNNHFDITMSNPEAAPFLTTYSEQWNCHSIPRPGPGGPR